MYWKSDDDVPLPSDLTIVGEQTSLLRGVTLVVVEGERLPVWDIGSVPWEFQSQAAMIDYRQGVHQ